jgi:hypothetical protein
MQHLIFEEGVAESKPRLAASAALDRRPPTECVANAVAACDHKTACNTQGATEHMRQALCNVRDLIIACAMRCTYHDRPDLSNMVHHRTAIVQHLSNTSHHSTTRNTMYGIGRLPQSRPQVPPIPNPCPFLHTGNHFKQINPHTCTPTRACTRIHKHTCIHTHARTRARTRVRAPSRKPTRTS